MDCCITDKLHEECGVLGIFDKGEVGDIVASVYYGLYALQHRGQESCGMSINDDGLITNHRDLGLVNEVFTKEVMANMPRGHMAIGHCRYATTGTRNRANAQPLLIRHVKGTMALAHNGNLTNAAELREEIELSGGIFHATSDTEVIAYTITKERLTAPSIEAAVCSAMGRLKGAYSIVVMSPRKLIAARDPMGFRPLCMGKIGDSTIFASESCALDAVGATFVREIEPGEVVVVTESGVQSIKAHCDIPRNKQGFCVFEYIYFARPDSVINNVCVHTARQRAGEFLAESNPVDADVVIGVPDSGLDAALGFSKRSGIPYDIGFLKNKYIGRTFIAPSQKQRENDVRIKLNPIPDAVRGKRVVLVDDSIVRGTTSLKIVKLVREAGATEVHMRLSSPPFKYPCYFGTDIDSSENLIAYKHSIDEIAKAIGVDSLGYLQLEDLARLAPEANCNMCDGCFTGKYPVDPPSITAKSKFEKKLSESKD
ncbi:MAG: amidophosphoribosyltransferase [Clostridia bacterium]|nr:amidophosphoribosyltransferase [Clostridia bacterium]NLS85991.1 amidophosphoribosyltransferase [Oscillospiraceae bacterium]